MKIPTDVAKTLLELEVGDNTLGWSSDEDERVPYPHNLQLVKEDLVDSSRWSLIYERIYKDYITGKFYSTSYSRGATESQDERPYQDEGEFTEFMEVVPRETITIDYVAAPRSK